MENKQVVRTFFAAVIGVLIVDLAGLIPAIADTFAWVDSVLARAGYGGLSALALVQAVVTGVVILAYQWVAQWLGDRWPRLEKIMLGSDARPHYEPRYGK